jgi:hypothetical protein
MNRIPMLNNRLFFANACSSTGTSLFVNEIKNFAWEFYKKGVAAFIGTLSLVPTLHAVPLAERFYEELLQGATIGKSFFYAKSKVEYKNPFWMFYTLYGDPFIRKFDPKHKTLEESNMALKTMVMFKDASEASELEIDGVQVLETLGKQENAMAVQLNEILGSVTDAVQESLTQEGELTVEISGALDIKTAAGVKYLFFNAGADVNRKNAMKVTLTTKVKPKNCE